MKKTLRKFSIYPLNNKCEKDLENNNQLKLKDTFELSFRNNFKIEKHPSTIGQDIKYKIKSTQSGQRKYSVPTNLFNKISLFHQKRRKRSLSLSTERNIKSSEKDRKITIHDNLTIDNHKLFYKTLEFTVNMNRDSFSDLIVPSRRYSEINLSISSTPSPVRTSPFLYHPLDNNRLSIANIGAKSGMSRRERRNSLSEFGFGKLESYNKYEILGKGTYSTVYKGQSLLTKDYVALKEVKLEEAEGAPCTAIREISLLRNLRHQNIVTLHDIIYQKNYLTLVFEYLEKNLKQYMEERNNQLDLTIVKSFMYQLLSGLDFCHHRRILHRDLKPQNLLINEKNELKLADFGLARAQSIPTKAYSNEVVTLWYRPPDLLLGKTDYSSHIDIWGAGCIFVEMLNGKALFPGHTADHQLNLIFEKLGSPTEDEWELMDLKAPKFHLDDFTVIPKPNSLLHLISTVEKSEKNQMDILLNGFLHLVGECRLTANEALQYSYFYEDQINKHNLQIPSKTFHITCTTPYEDPPFCENTLKVIDK